MYQENSPELGPENESPVVQEVEITMLRHSEPEYVDLVVGKTFKEIAELDEKGTFAKSGIKYPGGFKLAQGVGREMEELGVIPDLIVTSPLERAKETAILIGGELTRDEPSVDEDNQSPGIRMAVVEEFTELEPDAESFIYAQNQMREQGLLEDPERLSSWEEAGQYYRIAMNHWFENNHDEIEERVDTTIGCLKDLAQNRNAKNILIVSHGFSLNAIHARIERRDISSILQQKGIEPGKGYKLGVELESGLIKIKE